MLQKLTLIPKHITWILPDLQIEHNAHKACYECLNTCIKLVLFSLNIWSRSSILKFDLIYPHTPLKCPHKGWWTNFFKHILKHIDQIIIYQVWSKSDKNCRSSLSQKFTADEDDDKMDLTPGGWMVGPNAKSSTDFSSETTGQIELKHKSQINAHSGVGISIFNLNDPRLARELRLYMDFDILTGQ